LISSDSQIAGLSLNDKQCSGTSSGISNHKTFTMKLTTIFAICHLKRYQSGSAFSKLSIVVIPLA
jgi:hypothetical protein